MIKYSELITTQKLACISLFPEESKKDEHWAIRMGAYRALGYTEESKTTNNWVFRRGAYRVLVYTEESKKDIDRDIRLQAYRALGYTEEAKNDEEWEIRNEAEMYFEIKKQLEQQTTEKQLNGKIYKLIEITNE